MQHRGARFIRVDGREGDAALVVDGHMDVLGADAFDRVAAVAGDAMAGAGDTHQALDIEVQQVPRVVVLQPLYGRLRHDIGKRVIFLSITHKLSAQDEAELDIGKA